ncbi:hypothetical protein MAP00_009155 [Monascus purpureus]|nr:hypothetical protein MAP00_009155 [Monascus purpureus]
MSPSRKRDQDAPTETANATPRTQRRAPSPPLFHVPLDITLYLFLVSNGLSALYAPIQDCDEAFNFWEPAHYLDHGYGLQTWEYSPEYSIRSWLYVSLHAIVGKISALVVKGKVAEFYAIRFFLACFCAACETRLYAAICRTLSPRIGMLFLMVAAFSPGMFHASASFLPSSFTMCTSMLGLAAFLDWRGGLKMAQGVMWFGLGAIVGWPFAGALTVPLLIEELIIGFISGSMRTVFYSLSNGAVRCGLILVISTLFTWIVLLTSADSYQAAEVAVDFVFFQKFAIVPWNIVAYNIFGGQGRGPEIFGVEPWTFYIRNLLLNFNVWFILAMVTAPLLVLQVLFRPHATSTKTFLRSITLVAPFYMWFGIFTLQPHKEERFMYPSYPFLALNAAISLHIILAYISSSKPKEISGRVPLKLKWTLVISVILVAINAGLLRIVGMVTAYNAPLKVFEPLEQLEASGSLCLGKEWYRFPSSFFLPDGMRAKFIRSEFRGLLPGEFPEAISYLSRVESTSLVPPGMNDLNEEDTGKYIDISQCSFLVDSYFPASVATEREPHYVLDELHWEKVSCRKFLDASRTGLLGRLIWIPDLPIIPDRFHRKWGEYCLLRKRESE